MRQSLKRRARNRKNLSQVKTQVKKLRAAIAQGTRTPPRSCCPRPWARSTAPPRRASSTTTPPPGTRAGSPARSTRWPRKAWPHRRAVPPRAGLRRPPRPAPPAARPPSSSAGPARSSAAQARRRSSSDQRRAASSTSGTLKAMSAAGASRAAISSRGARSCAGRAAARTWRSERWSVPRIRRRRLALVEQRLQQRQAPPPRRGRRRRRSAGRAAGPCPGPAPPATSSARERRLALREGLQLVQLPHQPAQVLAHPLQQLLQRLRRPARSAAPAQLVRRRSARSAAPCSGSAEVTSAAAR